MKENKNRPPAGGRLICNRWILLFDIVLLAGATFLDQYVKALVRRTLPGNPKVLVENILEFYYLENAGAAFGMLQGQKLIFILIFAVVVIIGGYVLFHLPAQRKYMKLDITFVFILAGALGNAIDRIAKSTVTDFIYFKLIDFPVFNIADIYITVSTVFLMVLCLFVFKEEDFEFLLKNKAEGKEQPEEPEEPNKGDG